MMKIISKDRQYNEVVNRNTVVIPQNTMVLFKEDHYVKYIETMKALEHTVLESTFT